MAYEVFSVLSGLALMGLALAPGQRASTRAGLVLFGLGFIGYAIYVANQTSGTYYFPVQIFVLPFLIVGYAIWALIKRGGASTRGNLGAGQRSATMSGLADAGSSPAAAPGQRACTNATCPGQGIATRLYRCATCHAETQVLDSGASPAGA